LEYGVSLTPAKSWAKELHIGVNLHFLELDISSHYHKSGDFQDTTANREFFGLTQDWAFRSRGILAVRFSGYYGSGMPTT
jgi:hypothetical protein